VSLDRVDTYAQALSADARCPLLRHATQSTSGGSQGGHRLLLSTPAMHAVWPTRLRRTSGPGWCRSRHTALARHHGPGAVCGAPGHRVLPFSDTGVGKCSCNAMASVIMLWATAMEEALLISWTHQHRAGHPSPHGARRETTYRAGALLCLLALLVQLALAVEHTWDVSIEATAASAALAAQQPATGSGDTRAVFKAVKGQRRASHDPLLCSVCQLLSQAKIGITSHGPGIFLLQASFTVLLGSACHSSGIDLAASVPRAPPYLL